MTRETIYVAPLSLVESTVADASVSHLVTLINGETLIDTPPGIGPDRHLRLAMNDICEPHRASCFPARPTSPTLSNLRSIGTARRRS